MKEWVKVQRSPSTGQTVVTVTVMEDNLVSKYPIRTSWAEIGRGVREARAKAIDGLRQLQTAMAELEEAA